ncbi:MAG TPA: hypothetical protein PKA06_13575, partial [Gemmatales bacterium]|nr:hypothetical protein [Gemmatales bacterium]
MLLCLLLLLAEEKQTLGRGQPWYDQAREEEVALEGILDYQQTTGRVGVAEGFMPFRLLRRVGETTEVEQLALQAPGFSIELANLVGSRVNVVGKVQTRGEGESQRQVLLVGSVEPLGLAPALVFTEIVPSVRTSKFTAHYAKPSEGISTAIFRSNADVAKALGNGEGFEAEKVALEYLKTQLSVKNIDWKTQMVVYIGPIRQNQLSSRMIQVVRMEVHEKGANIYWRGDQQNQP